MTLDWNGQRPWRVRHPLQWFAGCLIFGLFLAFLMGALPQPWDSIAFFAFLAATLVFCIVQLIWLRRTQAEMRAMQARWERTLREHGHIG